jgi:PIN domain nuclease of toxin-antitoxin system
MGGEQKRLSKKAAAAIRAPNARILISAAVSWEVSIKRQLGKLEAPTDLLEQLEQAGVDLLPITARHANRVGTLPMHHRDPFDRLLVAQADVDGLTLVTADRELSVYGVELVW